jgi:hypothetical protein
MFPEESERVVSEMIPRRSASANPHVDLRTPNIDPALQHSAAFDRRANSIEHVRVLW